MGASSPHNRLDTLVSGRWEGQTGEQQQLLGLALGPLCFSALLAMLPFSFRLLPNQLHFSVRVAPVHLEISSVSEQYLETKASSSVQAA